MFRMIARFISGLALIALTSACAQPEPVREEPGARVLVFSHTTGWRHDSIEAGVEALELMASQQGWSFEASEDPAVFDQGALDRTDVLVLLSSTTGDTPESEWLTDEGRTALQAFVRAGGGVAAIHAAADAHYHWPWYRQMIGAAFEMHPPGTPDGDLSVVDSDHPATRELPEAFTRTDEWYWFSDFDGSVRLLMTLDAASIGEEGGDVPMAWAHEFEGGRVFYTALGHTRESFTEPLFLEHVRGGIAWAAGLED
ncbi:ThuA domain-containing protein [Alkalicaulis satelles]|uniref:ThuA domain-containing protein n=1 Tax=Alkalicaulis satelles TaxID=2609175 RepID=A0A5M6ZJX0_9PROT|nr:ThuA domain-containing protein [Alkalicaulis satelles]KAA5805113.1 ThuA domain-containing protein [Alkalicaulis satelles]